MDLPTRAERTVTTREIDHALSVLARTRDATVTLQAHENPDLVRVVLRAADGHTSSCTTAADNPSVLEALYTLQAHERLIVCGTPHVTRIGQRTRGRKHACGRAFAHRGMGPDGGVWRCQQCQDRKDQTRRARQRTRRRAATPTP